MKVLRDGPITESPWITLRRRTFYDEDDPEGEKHEWDYISLGRDRDVAVAYARFVPSADVLLIRQYRVVPRNHVWGFPAGLVEPGEDPADCAVRELTEETGYTGRVLWRSPPVSLNASLLTARAHIVGMAIDDDRIAGDQHLDHDEFITVHRVSAEGISEFLLDRAGEGDLIGGGLFYALVLPGLDLPR
jgi:ADP-ribose diphosphatase